jgi:thiamine pyrophosphokinase
VCLGLLGGRVDQEFNNLSNVSKYGALNKDTHMIALGGSSLMYLVKPNMKVSIKIGERCIKKKSGVVCFNRA